MKSYYKLSGIFLLLCLINTTSKIIGMKTSQKKAETIPLINKKKTAGKEDHQKFESKTKTIYFRLSQKELALRNCSSWQEILNKNNLLKDFITKTEEELEFNLQDVKHIQAGFFQATYSGDSNNSAARFLWVIHSVDSTTQYLQETSNGLIVQAYDPSQFSPAIGWRIFSKNKDDESNEPNLERFGPNDESSENNILDMHQNLYIKFNKSIIKAIRNKLTQGGQANPNDIINYGFIGLFMQQAKALFDLTFDLTNDKHISDGVYKMKYNPDQQEDLRQFCLNQQPLVTRFWSSEAHLVRDAIKEVKHQEDEECIIQ